VARIWILLFAALLAAACGGSKPRSAASIRGCIEKRVPRSAYDSVVASTEEGVVSLNYYRRGNETAVSIFPSEDDAAAAEEAEARLGDAHDRRVRNVLYSGGGAIERAVRACAT
jgi:hypothetical protein